jgi:hypothetical protein
MPRPRQDVLVGALQDNAAASIARFPQRLRPTCLRKWEYRPDRSDKCAGLNQVRDLPESSADGGPLTMPVALHCLLGCRRSGTRSKRRLWATIAFWCVLAGGQRARPLAPWPCSTARTS